jgi:hypothetical protein
MAWSCMAVIVAVVVVMVVRDRGHGRGHDGRALSVPMVVGVSVFMRHRIGAALGFERGLLLGHDQVHGPQHLRQHMVGFELQVVGLPAAAAHGGCPGGRPRAPGRRGCRAAHRAAPPAPAAPPPARAPGCRLRPPARRHRAPRCRAAGTHPACGRCCRWRRSGSCNARPSRVRPRARASAARRRKALALGEKFGDLEHGFPSHQAINKTRIVAPACAVRGRPALLRTGSSAAPSAARSPARSPGARRRRAPRRSAGRSPCAAARRCAPCRAC